MTKDMDAVDITAFFGAIFGTASGIAATGTLLWGFVYFGAYGIVYKLRRTETARRFAQRITDGYPLLESVAPKLLPGPHAGDEENTTVTIKQNSPIDVRVVDAYETSPFWKRVTQPLPGEAHEQTVFTAAKRSKQPIMSQQEAFLHKSLKRLPSYINYKQLPRPTSKLAVPIGIESIDGNVLWGDFSSDGNLIHALVAGHTGSGKDALLRLWFSTLTLQNKPDELQFVILDGKIDWLSPALAESAYMAIKPAGGIKIQKNEKGKRVNIAQYEMAHNLDWIFDEIERRSELFTRCGAVDLAGYKKRTGQQLPYIFMLASDVGGEFVNDLELLIQTLIMRGRSYGIRLIISMQNPVGEDTRWRGQIGLTMSGYQQNPDHDRYIMGMSVDRLLVRPSQLPNPEESDSSKGLFVTRLGTQQHLVRTAHMPEDDWYRYIEGVLPKKRDIEDQYLLAGLLSNQESVHIPTVQPKQSVAQKRVLTENQIAKIQELVFSGKNKTEIMLALGFSNGEVYKEKSPAVGIIITATKRKLGQ
jgi:hypothetical protein